VNAPVDPLLALFKSKKKVLDDDPLSQLKVAEDARLHHIFKLRKQGITVDMFRNVLKALSLLPDFHPKLHSAVQHYGVLYCGPFVSLLNGHAHVEVPTGQS
jgi:hypothetical protein